MSVIIPYYSEAEDLSDLFRSLADSYCSLPAGTPLELEVIVVNDRSPVPPGDPHGLPVRTIDLAWNSGVSAARNSGIKAARHERFLCLDADSILPRDFFARLVREMREHGEVPILQGLVSCELPAQRPSLFARYLAILNFSDANAYVGPGGNGLLLCSGCFLSTRSFFREIGFFDEKFARSGGEEFDILRRLPPGSIFQSRRVEVFHRYENLLPRLKKLWYRSRNYAGTAVFNPAFPMSLKITGLMRLAFAFAALAGLGVAFLDPAWGAALVSLAMTGLALADGGTHLRQFWSRGGLVLAILAPLFVFLEYVVAGAGCAFHGLARVFPGGGHAE